MAEKKREKSFPEQHQEKQPGRRSEMVPKPKTESDRYRPAGKLKDKVALITGGDSGIGRAVAIMFAKEGADIVIVYLNEHQDAQETLDEVERQGRLCYKIAGDVGDESFCRQAVTETGARFSKIDILVNNAGEQHVHESLEDISAAEWERTFKKDIFGTFYMTKAALPYMSKGGAIINTASVVAYRGNPFLIDYASAKGAIVAFTRSLALNLAGRGIRVNGVAPGPIRTPLIPSSFGKEEVAKFGLNTPMRRAGEPVEALPAMYFSHRTTLLT